MAAGDLGDDGLCLGTVDAGTTALEGALHLPEHDVARAVIRRREGEHAVLVEPLVGEGDQALVPTAVVPAKVRLRHVERKAVLQHRLEVGDLLVVLLPRLALEEAGRGHLLGVAHDDGLLRAAERPHRLAGLELGGLVEDDEVELPRPGFQVLRDRERAHEQARAQREHDVAALREDRAHRDVAAAAPERPLQPHGLRRRAIRAG